MTVHPTSGGKNMSAKRNDPPNRRGSNTWILLLVLAVFVAGTAYWAVQRRASAPTEPGSVYVAAPEGAPAPAAAHDHSATAPAAMSDTVPSYFASAEAAQPYPAIVSPDKFWQPVVVRAYQVAREMPGTLAQQPCYCFCYRIGHRGLLDCFASDHGSACSVCIQEALLAERMQKEGRSAPQIREAIIRGDWRSVELN